MTVSADRRGWGPGWPHDNSAKMTTIRAERSGVTLLVHREVAPILKFCIDTIEARGHLFDYGPKDVNDDWGYANRPIRGTSVPSNHSWGLAVDLDATKYPQGQRAKRPPQWVDDIFAKYRFDNGAPWRNPDPMHYEFNGTPADARFLVASLAGHAIDATPAPLPPSVPARPPLTPPPYIAPQEADVKVYALTYPNRVEYWLLYADGWRTNLSGNADDIAAMQRSFPTVTIAGEGDCNRWKNFTTERTYSQIAARPLT